MLNEAFLSQPGLTRQSRYNSPVRFLTAFR